MKLLGVNGKLVAAELGGGPGSVLNARTTPDAAGPWEDFTLLVQPGGRVAFLADQGFYVSAQEDGTVAVDRPALGPWEQWTPVVTPAGTAYLSAHGQFLSCDLSLPVDSPDGWSGHRIVANRSALGPWELFQPLGLPPATLPRLHTRGAYFEQATGDRWTAIECTDFRLLERLLAGEDLDPVLADRAVLGFNLLRVLGMCHQMFRLYPWDHTNYFDGLATLARRAARYGLYVELTAFADATVAMPQSHDQRMHWDILGHALRDEPNVIVELVNENDQSINHIDAGLFDPLDGLLCSHGSNGSQADPVGPWWAYETFHTNDAPQWWRKVGHNAMEYSAGARTIVPSRVPILANENTRPDRDPVTHHFEDAAAGAALLCAGACFHSNSGKDSVVFTGRDRECAEAWVRGARSVPLAAQGQPYRRRDDLLAPSLLRVYQRGFDDAAIVRIRT